MKPNKTFIVLGMGRSATSLVAQALHKYGVHMGNDLMPANKGNPKGHYEDLEFVHLNNFLIQKAGGTVNNPPSRDKVKELDFNVKEFIEAKDNKSLWGWKDPRTVVTIDKYYDYIKDPIIVSCFRDPDMVAKSLVARDGCTYEEGIRICLEYQQRTLDFLNERFGKNWKKQ